MSKVDELIARVRELDAKATPGPWDAEGSGGIHMDGTRDYYTIETIEVRHLNQFARSKNGEANANLVAHYRTLAPKLADMLERAMEELECVRVSSSFRIRQDAADAIDEIEAMAEGGES